RRRLRFFAFGLDDPQLLRVQQGPAPPDTHPPDPHLPHALLRDPHDPGSRRHHESTASLYAVTSRPYGPGFTPWFDTTPFRTRLVRRRAMQFRSRCRPNRPSRHCWISYADDATTRNRRASTISRSRALTFTDSAAARDVAGSES